MSAAAAAAAVVSTLLLLVVLSTASSIAPSCELSCTGPHTLWRTCTFRIDNCSTATDHSSRHATPLRTIQLFNGAKDDLSLIYRNEALARCSRRCHFTTDRTARADAVLFALIYLEASHLPVRQSAGPLWIAHCAESPLAFFGRHLRSPAMMARFDRHVTLADSAHVRFNYLAFDLFAERTWPRLVAAAPPALAAKSRLVAWIATNCNAPNRRHDYVAQLMQHMAVDNHGDCLRNMPRDNADLSAGQRHATDWQQRKIELLARYHFVLAFENSAVDNYVTEKFYDAFLAGTVPVFMGARNVHRFAPANDSFIDVADFASPQALAEHLIAVANDAERRVHKESTTGHTTSERVKLTLELRVDNVDFDPQASTLRLKGTNRTESPLIKLGASQTIAIELNRELTLVKSEWDQVSLKRIKDAADPSTTADAAAVVMDEGIATLCLLKANMNVTVATIDVSVPRKRRGSSSQHDEGMKKFFAQVMASIEQKFRFDILKVILVASPGFVREAFLKYMWATAVTLDKKALLDQRAKFVAVHSTSGHKHALAEVLVSPEALKLLADTKFAAEVKLLARFTELLRTAPERAYYGYQHVLWANKHKAVETMLITDELFRAASIEKRREYIALVDAVKRNGGEVHIFSALHVSGEQLQQLTGVAAILRYELAEPDDLADNSSDSSSDSDQSANGGGGGSFNAFRAREGSALRTQSSATTRSDATSLTRKSQDDDSISITSSDDDDIGDNDDNDNARDDDDNNDDDDDDNTANDNKAPHRSNGHF